MCGIFGLRIKHGGVLAPRPLRRCIEELLLLSQERGKDASGITVKSGEVLRTFKRPGNASEFLRDERYRTLVDSVSQDLAHGFTLIGQCRLVTHGSREQNENNQPLERARVIGVHNGIVTNLAEGAYGSAESLEATNDSSALFSLIDNHLATGGGIRRALRQTFAGIEGSASLAMILPGEKELALATNTGSLYFAFSEENKSLIFASERSFLEKVLADKSAQGRIFQDAKIVQLRARTALVFDEEDGSIEFFDLPQKTTETPSRPLPPPTFSPRIVDRELNLKRCQKCILPHTYPSISFDDQGVCNFCRRYDRQVPFGEAALMKLLEPYRSKDGSPDCLVGLSGGRDSCYGLHVLKTKYGMNPIAYTFDWGLTTEVSRRNQAKVCGKLGIEHVLRAPDIRVKRENVRVNIEAFLKRPHLGMVPLFMAGDKAFYEYGRTLRRDLRLPLTVFCAGHSLEQRDFMTGFCGVDENITNNKRLYKFSMSNKLRLICFYASQYLLNPAYINRSLGDSIRSFVQSFLNRDDFLYLFEYLPWEESEIESVLAREYDWEADRMYGKNQWRMGDGQTAFTNYIYYQVAGFSEFDNFRSNQIRQGMITRDEALELVKHDNAPKLEVLESFAHTIGLDLRRVLSRIDEIPKLYRA